MMTKLLFFRFYQTFRMNEQPAPQGAVPGFGCGPNKRIRKSCKVVPLCTACEFENLYRFTLLANL